MKHTFNLLSEVLALPLSEKFFRDDVLAEQIRKAWGDEADNVRLSDRCDALGKNIDCMGAKVAGYINVHANLISVSELQNLINYVFSAQDITRLAADRKQLHSSFDIANQYYFSLLMRTAKTFLTSQDEKATFKYFPGSLEPYAHSRRILSANQNAYWFQELLGADFETNRIEAWHSLLQCIPAELLICAYAAVLTLKDSSPDKRDKCAQILRQFGDTVHIADRVLNQTLSQGLAETHLHANASRSFGMIWEDVLSAATNGKRTLERNYIPIFDEMVLEQDCRTWAKEAAVVRALAAAYLKYGDRGDFCAFLQSGAVPPRYSQSFWRVANDLAAKGISSGLFSSAAPVTALLLRDLRRPASGNALSLDLGLAEHTGDDVGFPERCLVAWSMLHIYEHPGDVYFTATVLYYLRIKNIFYRFRVQDSKNKGLDYFKQYYAQSTDAGSYTVDHRMTNIIATAIRDERTQKVELRSGIPFPKKEVTPRHLAQEIQANIKSQLNMLIRQHVYVIASLYGKYPTKQLEPDFSQRWVSVKRRIRQGKENELQKLLEGFNVDIDSVHQHRLGVVYHFNKQGEQREERACFVDKRKPTELTRRSVFSFGKTRYHAQYAVDAISSVRALAPEVSRLIVGIDAASAELPTEPWVFSPAFRLARERDSIPGQPGKDGSGKALLGITYHVGEEFRHPLSGLRHISEAVTFYKMHAGDRLGHALALGLDLGRWFSNHGLITLPQIEWMEDCLWAWEVATNNPLTEDGMKYVSFLERQILSCANEIYGRLDGISVEKLYQAYKNKTLDYPQLARLADDWRAKHTAGSIDCAEGFANAGFFPCAGSKKTSPDEWWDETSLTLSFHCSYYKNRMSQQIIKEPTREEIELTKALQKHLRRIIAKKGLVVEENPSSNAVIGEMDGVLSHPVCELRRESDAPAVMASINTDDPSVFNASVSNEHGLIYFTLIHHGLSSEQAAKTVDELRRTGLNSSFIKDVIPFKQLLEEYEQVIRVI